MGEVNTDRQVVVIDAETGLSLEPVLMADLDRDSEERVWTDWVLFDRPGGVTGKQSGPSWAFHQGGTGLLPGDPKRFCVLGTGTSLPSYSGRG